MENITIKDIARLSDVSVATVSRVINNNGRFSEKTRQKVLKVIEETGYQMNYSAKSLRMKRSFTIGILVPDISNYFFADVVQQLEEQLFDLGYSTIICNTGRNAEKEQKYLTILESKSVDGIIVISGANEDGIEFNFEKEIPYVCIDRKPKVQEDTVFISSNHYQGGFIATEELIDSGCSNLLLILHQEISSSSKERVKGFVDALKKNNLPYSDENNMFFVGTNKGEYRGRFKKFLDSHPDIDGIFTVNDNLGLQIMKFLLDMNISVPDTLKLIGFDDIPSAVYSTPTLSSIKQNTEEISKAAIQSLLKLIDDDESDKGKQIVIPVKLVERQSTNHKL